MNSGTIMNGTLEITPYSAVRMIERAVDREIRTAQDFESSGLDILVLEAMSKTSLRILPKGEQSILRRHGEEYLQRRAKEEEILDKVKEQWYEFGNICMRNAGTLVACCAGAGIAGWYFTHNESQTILHTVVTGPILHLGYVLGIETPGRISRTYQRVFTYLTPHRKEFKEIRREQRFQRDLTEMKIRQSRPRPLSETTAGAYA